jgi:hypothetical protein
MADFPDRRVQRIDTLRGQNRIVILMHVVKFIFVGVVCVCSKRVWLHVAKD